MVKIKTYLTTKEHEVIQKVTQREKNKSEYMTRNELLRKLGRYLLLMLIALIAIALGNKVITTNECSKCPGNGICNGKTDCNQY